MVLLQLYELTLFYFNISSEKQQQSGLIKKWATNVALEARPNKLSKQSTSSTTFPHSGTTCSKATTNAPSVLAASRPSGAPGDPIELQDAINDTQERFANLMSPKKDKVRLTSNVSDCQCNNQWVTLHLSQTVMKIEDDQEPLINTVKKPTGEKFKNEHLPFGATHDNLWQWAFMPTYIQYIASQQDPWVFDDDSVLCAMQTIWDNVYGSQVVHTIKINQAVFSIVHSCSWFFVSLSL